MENQENNKQPLPQLFSKTVILAFSCFFSPLIASILMMYNMSAMQQPKGRTQVLFFGIAYLFVTMLVINSFPQMQNVSIVFNIAGAAILNEYFWNKFIGAETEYERRDWKKPALYALAFSIPIIIYAVLKMQG